jgi:hypothetical protein
MISLTPKRNTEDLLILPIPKDYGAVLLRDGGYEAFTIDPTGYKDNKRDIISRLGSGARNFQAELKGVAAAVMIEASPCYALVHGTDALGLCALVKHEIEIIERESSIKRPILYLCSPSKTPMAKLYTASLEKEFSDYQINTVFQSSDLPQTVSIGRDLLNFGKENLRD